MPTRPSPYEVAQKQFDRTADLLELEQAPRDLLRYPLREYHFNIPVRMDDGSVQVFRGYQVQQNDAAIVMAVGKVANACGERGWL